MPLGMMVLEDLAPPPNPSRSCHTKDIITGSIARSANLPVFSLLRG